MQPFGPALAVKNFIRENIIGTRKEMVVQKHHNTKGTPTKRVPSCPLTFSLWKNHLVSSFYLYPVIIRACQQNTVVDMHV
jgi:hypothetical protein